jgi:hypothetical protein
MKREQKKPQMPCDCPPPPPPWPNIKLTCPAAMPISDNYKQDAARNNLRGRVRCSNRMLLKVPVYYRRGEVRPE